MNDVRTIFLQEAQDLLEDLDSLLLDIEENDSPRGLVEQFMRRAHTLKGSAATAGFSQLADLAHRVEDVVELLRDGRVESAQATFDLLSRALEVVGAALSALHEVESEPASVGEMVAHLADWLAAGDEAEEEATAGSLEIGEYDELRVRLALEKGQQVYRVETPLAADAEGTWAAASELLARARDVGDVILTDPPEWELERLEEIGCLTCLIATDASVEDLEEAFTADGFDAPRLVVHQQAAPAPASELPAAAGAALLMEKTVRIETRQLDDLLRLVGELVTQRARFQQLAVDLRSELRDVELAADVDDAASRLGHVAAELQEAVMRARMVPMSRLLRTIKRSVRQALRGKQGRVRLSGSGLEVELDKGVMDRLTGPLAEAVAGLADGDGQSAAIALDATTNGTQVTLRLTSAGAGIDALAQPLEETLAVLGGELEVEPLDDGSRIALRLPTNLSIVPVMMVTAGDEVYGFPLEDVQETLRLSAAEVASVGGERTYDLRGDALSLLFLDEVLDVPRARDAEQRAVLVVNGAAGAVGVVVDRLLGKQDIVIKPLGRRFNGVRALGGSAILGDGRVALVLNAGPLVQDAL